MKITKTTTHDVTFQVQAFWDEEGGMGHNTFGPACSTLEEAIHQMELANATGAGHHGTEWVIVCEVETKVAKS